MSRDDNEVAVLTAQKLQLWAVYPSHERPTEEVLSVEFVNSAQQPVQEELIEAVEAFGFATFDFTRTSFGCERLP